MKKLTAHPSFLKRHLRRTEQELDRKEAVLQAEQLVSDLRINQLLDLKLALRRVK